MREQLARWLAADTAISKLKEQLEETKLAIYKQELEADDARKCIATEMIENGVVEETIEGEFMDYVLAFSTPRESVKADADATPDEFVKVERKPKLKEIGAHIKSLRDAGEPMPNWASLEMGESKLNYKLKKRG